jgi:hypothetical protein
MADDSMRTYRALRHTDVKPSEAALSNERRNLADALQDMGTGIVVSNSGDLVAFHESHLALIERRAAAGRNVLGFLR